MEAKLPSPNIDGKERILAKIVRKLMIYRLFKSHDANAS